MIPVTFLIFVAPTSLLFIVYYLFAAKSDNYSISMSRRAFFDNIDSKQVTCMLCIADFIHPLITAKVSFLDLTSQSILIIIVSLVIYISE